VSIAVSDATSTRFAPTAARAIAWLLPGHGLLYEQVFVSLLEKMHRAFSAEWAKDGHRKKYSSDNT